jgi:hypothetical protein
MCFSYSSVPSVVKMKNYHRGHRRHREKRGLLPFFPNSEFRLPNFILLACSLHYRAKILSRRVVMNKIQLEKKVAKLEFVHDQLESELLYVDNLLKSVGFPQGLASAKEVALELIENGDDGLSPHENNEPDNEIY